MYYSTFCLQKGLSTGYTPSVTAVELPIMAADSHDLKVSAARLMFLERAATYSQCPTRSTNRIHFVNTFLEDLKCKQELLCICWNSMEYIMEFEFCGEGHF